MLQANMSTQQISSGKGCDHRKGFCRDFLGLQLWLIEVSTLVMAQIHITDLESAINWWRARSPSEDGISACAEVRALATAYAIMVYRHEHYWDESLFSPEAMAAWLVWYATTPDTPCIAICSTSQGDATCKGCGRSESEVQNWTIMTPTEKRATWRRITLEGESWRFNRYAERAREKQTN